MSPSAIQNLKDYLDQETDVVLAFLFGSVAKKQEKKESDVDIALLLKNKDKKARIWSKITSLLQKEIDLVFFDEAPATLISTVFKTGIPLKVKDRKSYWDMYLTKSMESEDFGEFAESFWKIYQRSHSLSSEDKTRLLERVQFLEQEVSEIGRFRELSFGEYQKSPPKRREIERWTENIINAIIDIAKIFLASEKKDMPKTYGDALRNFALAGGLDDNEAYSFSQFARLRNILAHEYLGILYGEIRNFIEEFFPLYRKISKFIKEYLN